MSIHDAGPLTKASSQTDFALNTADADGVKTAFVPPIQDTTYSGSSLNGADMTGGQLENEPRNLTVTTAAHTGAYLVGTEIVVTGKHALGHIISENLAIGDADGGETLICTQCFAHEQELSVSVPYQNGVVVGTVPGPWAFNTDGLTLLTSIDGAADETTTWNAARAVETGGAGPYEFEVGDDITIELWHDAINASPVLLERVTTEVGGGTDTHAEVVGTIAGPWNFAPGDTLVVEIDGGGDETATFDAAAAVLDAGAGPYNLVEADDLIVEVFNGATLLETVTIVLEEGVNVVDIDAVTAAELVTALDAETPVAFDPTDAAGTLRLTGVGASHVGTNNHIEVSGAGAAAIFSVATEADGTGDVGNIDAVTPAEVKTVVEADTTATVTINVGNTITVSKAGAVESDTIQVQATSDLEGILGLDTDLHTEGVVVTAAALAALIEAQGTTLFEATDAAGAIRITATGGPIGLGSRLQISGSGRTRAGLDALTRGTGDVVDLRAVTPLEVKTRVEADSAAEVLIMPDDTIRVYKPAAAAGATIQVQATSTAEVILGLDTAVHMTGSLQIGTGVAKSVHPPSKWLHVNEDDVHIFGRPTRSKNIVDWYVKNAGDQPLAIDALHAGTTATDMVAKI